MTLRAIPTWNPDPRRLGAKRFRFSRKVKTNPGNWPFSRMIERHRQLTARWCGSDAVNCNVPEENRRAIRAFESDLGEADRGIPTEETLAEMRAATPKVHYLAGTPEGRLTRLEKVFLPLPGGLPCASRLTLNSCPGKRSCTCWLEVPAGRKKNAPCGVSV